MDICVENLLHTYTAPDLEARTVLDIDVWHVPAGAQVLLRGVSVSGKTTLLNILAGLLPPTAGTVWLGSHSLFALRGSEHDHLRATTIGYIFQMHHLARCSRPSRMLRCRSSSAARSSQANAARARELLASVGLSEFDRRRPVQLSTGQRLRVAVARALAARPAIVLADEPTAALDELSGAVVMDLLQESCRQRGATLIVASHDPALAHRFDQAVDIHNGVLHKAVRTTAARQNWQ